MKDKVYVDVPLLTWTVEETIEGILKDDHKIIGQRKNKLRIKNGLRTRLKKVSRKIIWNN